MGADLRRGVAAPEVLELLAVHPEVLHVHHILARAGPTINGTHAPRHTHTRFRSATPFPRRHGVQQSAWAEERDLGVLHVDVHGPGEEQEAHRLAVVRVQRVLERYELQRRKLGHAGTDARDVSAAEQCTLCQRERQAARARARARTCSGGIPDLGCERGADF
eukprot:507620-Rhodomonas_salina.1